MIVLINLSLLGFDTMISSALTIFDSTIPPIMACAMFRAEANGYPVVLTVHDELLTEPPLGFGSSSELARIMSVLPDFAQRHPYFNEPMPLAAAAWEDVRYVK